MNAPVLKDLSSLMQASADGDPVINLPEEAPFDPRQREWLSGLLTGLGALVAAAQTAGEDAPKTPLSILYGSQSGNCEVLAKDLKKYAATQGFDAVMEELDATDLKTVATRQHLLILCSTFGEGEPPDNARNFFDALMADDAAPLPAELNFAVCGLGDSSYAQFNQCGKDIYGRLVELGASPCCDFISCDVAFEDDYADWKTAVFETPVFAEAAGAAGVVDSDEPAGPAFDKNHPFLSNLIRVESLSGEGSAKCVNHVEISLAGGGEDMHYDVGDALGVWPLNCPEEVEEILAAGSFTGSEVVQQKSGAASLRVLLLSKLDIHTVNTKTLEAWGVGKPPVDAKVVDILVTCRPDLNAQAFVDGLRPLQPRLYSIASSPKAHPGEVHLTVGEVRYDLFDKARKGVASTWLGKRLTAGSNVGVYVQASKHFHIPADDEAPLIMIGPGTGIAPFRAFLEEREAREAQGKNWLFFGDQHEAEDFLYREQITAWQSSGLLNEISLAWSRDGAEKVYVQTLIRARGAEFFSWLEQGGYIYVCGDASRMAADVDATIREVIGTHGGLDEEGVNAYMDRLVANHRYQRDVY